MTLVPSPPELWHVGELPVDDGLVVRDEKGLRVAGLPIATRPAGWFAATTGWSASISRGVGQGGAGFRIGAISAFLF